METQNVSEKICCPQLLLLKSGPLYYNFIFRCVALHGPSYDPIYLHTYTYPLRHMYVSTISTAANQYVEFLEIFLCNLFQTNKKWIKINSLCIHFNSNAVVRSVCEAVAHHIRCSCKTFDAIINSNFCSLILSW